MMAALEVTAVVPAPPNPDEDAWLYGDTQPKTNGSTLDANATEFISQAQNGQNSEEDSDSDDDDVQITIRDITKAAPGPYGIPYQPPQISALPAPKTVSVIGQTSAPPSGPVQASTKRTIDVNAVGSINGVPIYDYDIETMCEERPWRIPGADMTDYFNYGFNEVSWKAYCEKQRGVRVIAGEGNKNVKIVEQVKVNETLPSLSTVPPGSIYNKHSVGSIDVIGSHKERDTGVPHPIHTPTAPRMVVPGMPTMPTMPGMIPPMMPGMFPPPGQLPTGFPQAFPPGLAPPGLAPPPEIRPEIKREDGGYKVPPTSMSMAGPLPPPRGMFPMPGAPIRPPMLPNMLPPPGSAMAPPMLLPPPLFSDSGSDSGSAGEERRRSEQRGERRRSHSREKRSRRTRDHKDRSSDRHSRSSGGVRRDRDRKDRDKTRRSSRGDESSRHRHRRDDEGRTKRSRRKRGSKSGGEDEVEEVEAGVKEVEATNGD